jgi:threonine dehydrogenase-like Zn-dependent dehydrogenase
MLKGIVRGFEEAVYPPIPKLGREGGGDESTSYRHTTPNSYQSNPSAPSSCHPRPTTLPATGLEAALICTDSLEGYATGLELLAKHGTLVYIGQPKEPVPMHWSAFVTKDIRIVAGCLPSGGWIDGRESGVGLSGSKDEGIDGGKGNGRREGERGGCEGRWMSARDVMRDMMEVVERSEVHVEVTEYKLDDFGRMLESFRREGMKGKVVLRIEED